MKLNKLRDLLQSSLVEAESIQIDNNRNLIYFIVSKKQLAVLVIERQAAIILSTKISDPLTQIPKGYRMTTSQGFITIVTPIYPLVESELKKLFAHVEILLGLVKSK